jgi:hypothetical protein
MVTPSGGNYDFSGANVIPGVSCGMAGSESVVIIALWCRSTKAGFPDITEQFYYKFKGQASTRTDCG